MPVVVFQISKFLEYVSRSNLSRHQTLPINSQLSCRFSISFGDEIPPEISTRNKDSLARQLFLHYMYLSIASFCWAIGAKANDDRSPHFDWILY